MRLWRSCAAALLMGLAAQSASALDWRSPWIEPQDSAAAAQRSDEYAWRLFVALNWPADPTARTADHTARFGAHGPVVWETWQSAGNVYLEDGADPGPWISHGPTESLKQARRFETFSLQTLFNARHIVGGVMVPLLDPIASARRLTEIRMNQRTYEFIRARELYNLDGQMRAYSGRSTVSFPYGAKEVKAKWRPLDPGEGGRYYTTRVTLEDGTQRLYGLTGLHIASKDLPHWFWATFEQVDNPTLRDGEGWRLPSQDRFSCRGEHEQADCNRAPPGIGLEGTVWQNYRLRGTLTGFVNAAGEPRVLANSELETGLQNTSSCITCHSRASIGVVDGAPVRLPIFEQVQSDAADPRMHRGFLGIPKPEWYQRPGADSRAQPAFQPLDFVWSLLQAKPKKASAEIAVGSGGGDSGASIPRSIALSTPFDVAGSSQ